MPLVPRYLIPRSPCAADLNRLPAIEPERKSRPAVAAKAASAAANALTPSIFMDAFTLLYKSVKLALLFALMGSAMPASAGVRVRDLIMVSGRA